MRRHYPFHLIESKWQRLWLADRAFRAFDPGEPIAESHPFRRRHGRPCAPTSADPYAPKFYILDMFPYPSGSGLHVGHPEGYTATDILARYRRMRGCHVMHPMGWDAFGLPAEQYAIDTGTHPSLTTKKNIDTFRRQIRMLGFSYDWEREVNTTSPAYFKWTQWIFLQLHKKGLAYQAEVPVWWCEGCKAVLANEEVNADGTCDRKGHKEVYRRPLRQWILKITAYAERLLKDLELVHWPESIKEQQRNWIGRSEGAHVEFRIENSEFRITVFTTRPDTLFGATYMVLAPEHPLVEKITAPAQRQAIETYRTETTRKSERERAALEKDKTGVFTGAYALNPVNHEKIPIWIADYVMMGYGTGAIMAVPAHDERDFEFAKKFGLSITPVVGLLKPKTFDLDPKVGVSAYGLDMRMMQVAGKDATVWIYRDFPVVEDGVSVNSGLITGLPTPEAKQKITAWLEEKNLGKATVQYKLRDWLFSRQRYWGEPIPIIHCPNCKIVPVPESELPLQLPEMKDYTPAGNAEPPLAKAADWVNCQCPSCGGPGKRETNTMPQWAGSCWYYLRYLDTANPSAFCDAAKSAYWLGSTPSPETDLGPAPHPSDFQLPASSFFQGVDLYVGGAEHAVLHLLYARFWHKVLFDLGHVPTPEPFLRLVNQGMILGEDNQKMSKSRGNVINPDDVVREHGADAFRLYEMFMGPLEASKPWSTEGLQGVYRFLGRVWRLFTDEESVAAFEQKLTLEGQDGDAAENALREIRLHPLIQDAPAAEAQKVVLHKTIHKVTGDLDALAFNTAISAMMIFVNEAMTWERRPREIMEPFLLLLAPFAPHLAEELGSLLGKQGTLGYAPWPACDPKYLAEDEVDIVLQVNGKLRDKIRAAKTATREELEALARVSLRVQESCAGKPIRKVIVVPGKLVNLVV